MPEIEDILIRIRARDQVKSELCWNCRRPLPLKSRACPHCGETL
jgi:predicted amidophosphoribosyltransferase